MSRQLLIIIFTAVLASYASSASSSSANYIYNVKKGDKFALKKDINITRSAHVLLQNGEIMKFANIDKYAPFCRFEVNTKGDQTIKPATFTVTRVNLHEPEVLPRVYNYAVEFRLDANNDPHIRSLTCGAWGSNTESYITFPQMQHALGSYFETPMPK